MSSGATAGASATESGPSTSPLPSSISDKLEAAQKLKDEGNALLQAGELRQAARKYRTVFLYVNGLVGKGDNVAQYTPREDLLNDDQQKIILDLKVTVYANLALAYLKLEEPAKAVDVANRALEINPDHVKALVRKGQALVKQKDFDKAKASLLKANKLEPENKAILVEISRWKAAYKTWSQEQHEKQKKIFGGALAGSK
mmetsp:Transcript_17897/g.35297  ORF Transcript_17897/g.35297 Transcript_17897/m.35297 type:complete len:200 (-) Transcript_17897:149-748(-)|eukprot:CAMPEP_0171523266 /NCGR_PEP_ID=MMETSP0959-20130129/8300_1 /TAXON_ID=87120 /ORGANISM="Aurantiochytrium limacinum, Strain ATCCMYA-1381" /LENGTH=199 /DNA_ID=CAMNT_0012063675 /DNA_START=24 /DNA_END=623 /DNA_ORIENTATION=-